MEALLNKYKRKPLLTSKDFAPSTVLRGWDILRLAAGAVPITFECRGCPVAFLELKTAVLGLKELDGAGDESGGCGTNKM